MYVAQGNLLGPVGLEVAAAVDKNWHERGKEQQEEVREIHLHQGVDVVEVGLEREGGRDGLLHTTAQWRYSKESGSADAKISSFLVWATGKDLPHYYSHHWRCDDI